MTLGLNSEKLKQAIGFDRGFGLNSSEWNEHEQFVVDQAYQTGLRQFYYPDNVDGFSAYRWSFIDRTYALPTVADDFDYDLPSDFGALNGSLRIQTTVNNYRQVEQVGVPEWQHLRAGPQTAYPIPAFCAVRWKDITDSSQQQAELLLWPTPSSVLTIDVNYEVLLSGTTNFPFGSEQYAETVRLSCLAAAEVIHPHGPMRWQALFIRSLTGAIDRDRRQNVGVGIGYNFNQPDYYNTYRQQTLTHENQS